MSDYGECSVLYTCKVVRYLKRFDMATARNKPKNQKIERKPWPNEVLGILFFGGGLLLLLSLISFSPHDLTHIPGMGGGWRLSGGRCRLCELDWASGCFSRIRCTLGIRGGSLFGIVDHDLDGGC